MIQPRRAVITFVAVLALAVAGCGGDTAEKNDYVDAVNKAQTDFANSMSQAQTGAVSGKPEDAEKTFDSLEAGVDKIVADLKAVDPPDDVASLHDQLVENMAKFGTVIDDASKSVTSGDTQKILEAQTKFVSESSKVANEVSQTITQINTELQK